MSYLNVNVFTIFVHCIYFILFRNSNNLRYFKVEILEHVKTHGQK